MPLITQEGQAAKNRIAEFRQNINNGATSKEARATLRQIQAGPSGMGATPPGTTPQLGAGTTPSQNGPSTFSLNLPPEIPSTALAGNNTFADIFAARNNAEQSMTQFSDLQSRINNPGNSLFSDPDAMINRLLLNRTPTGSETARDQVFNTAQQGMTNYASDIATARTDANTQLGVPGLVDRLAKTREDYALRENRLNEDLKRLELNAERRAVDRQFVEAEKNKLKSDALQDLANLASIEKAQSGSLQEARSLVNDIMADKKSAFELENQQLQSQINFLNTKVGEENQVRASQLQVALNERKARQDKILADEKEIRDLIVNVASEGGDEATLAGLNGALKDGNVSEALRLAGPWVGRMQRMQAEASIANSYNQINSRNLNDLIARAEKGDPNAIAELGFDPTTTTGNFEAESSLRKEFNALEPVKQATAVQTSFNQINSAYQQALQASQDGSSKAAADQALIISFNKMLDPNSVVREGEFARSTEGQSLINKWKAKAEQIQAGGAGLTDDARAEIVTLTGRLYADYIQTHNDKAFQYRQNAIRQGGDPNYVAGYIDTIGITAENAAEGAVIIRNGTAYQKQGDKMIELDI